MAIALPAGRQRAGLRLRRVVDARGRGPMDDARLEPRCAGPFLPARALGLDGRPDRLGRVGHQRERAQQQQSRLAQPRSVDGRRRRRCIRGRCLRGTQPRPPRPGEHRSDAEQRARLQRTAGRTAAHHRSRRFTGRENILLDGEAVAKLQTQRQKDTPRRTFHVEAKQFANLPSAVRDRRRRHVRVGARIICGHNALPKQLTPPLPRE